MYVCIYIYDIRSIARKKHAGMQSNLARYDRARSEFCKKLDPKKVAMLKSLPANRL